MQNPRWNGPPGQRPGVPATGFCTLHNRKRLRSELMMLPGPRGGFRCQPRMECSPAGPPPIATPGPRQFLCRAHQRLRNANELREVGPDVFECIPQFSCERVVVQQQPPIPAPAPVVRPSGGLLAPPPGMAPRSDLDGVAAPLLPLPKAAPSGPTTTRGVASGPGDKSKMKTRAGAGLGEKEVKVWCARHGKQLPKGMCETVDECFHVCLDPAGCLSTPFEEPSALNEKGCKELLCNNHGTMRLVSFLELSSDKKCYTCPLKHRCRGITTTALIQRDAIDDEDGNAHEFAESDSTTALYSTNDIASTFYL